ncbi:MAG: DUF4290 domain-containing protein [Bacteroidaceae bacterium]|nr:DUF4290 domain-containing protein [Bacteroidaceae bacterium]
MPNTEKDYNTQRERLIMPEYGRGVQKMVEYAVSLPTKEQRQACAEFIIGVMSRLHADQVSAEELENKLWNHLARIARYKLDVDYPVDIILEEETTQHPAPLPYPMKKIHHRHYGHLLEASLKHLCDMEEGEERQQYLESLANQMKQSLFMWNPDSMDDDLVATDIERYTDGKVKLDLQNFRFAAVNSPATPQGGKRKKNK